MIMGVLFSFFFHFMHFFMSPPHDELALVKQSLWSLTALLVLSLQMLVHSWRSFQWGQGQNVLGSQRCLQLEMWWMTVMRRPSPAGLFCCEFHRTAGGNALAEFSPSNFIFLSLLDTKALVVKNTRKCNILGYISTFSPMGLSVWLCVCVCVCVYV